MRRHKSVISLPPQRPPFKPLTSEELGEKVVQMKAPETRVFRVCSDDLIFQSDAQWNIFKAKVIDAMKKPIIIIFTKKNGYMEIAVTVY